MGEVKINFDLQGAATTTQVGNAIPAKEET
jgi:hypothetical protein